MEISIHELTDDHFAVWVRMRGRLWDDDPEDCAVAYTLYTRHRSESRAMNLVAVDATGSPLGFIESALRSDYVEGLDTSPVWYVEGVFTEEHARKKGVARKLVRDLVKRVGATHLASDCEHDNEQSRLFHEAIGFHEVGRSIHFVKRFEDNEG